MAYWRLHYHAVWACKECRPLITPEVEPELYRYLWQKGLHLQGIMHAIGGIEDHVHVVFSLPPKIAVASFIGNLKGASSYWATKVLQLQEFDWHRGYGVVSFATKHLPHLIQYAQNQKMHHDAQTTRETLERWSEEDDGVVMYWEEPGFSG
ncbi:MAG: IS200/IS605 family transposase [Calditrichaeota bacterium]|nr:MAG: IS200/IS605 family transposase [Calditrichota bacterium]